MADEQQGKDKWLPLEANPEVMNKYVSNLGMKLDYSFTDVLGLDSDLLAMVPQPCIAILLLYPVTAKDEEVEGEKSGVISPNLYFMKQTVDNACGTIGLIHALGNCQDQLTFGEGSFLKGFFEKTKNMNPDERALALEMENAISEAHESSAQEGDSATPNRDDRVDLHFICFVQKDGHIYELDGTKPSPVNHGPSSSESFLQDAARVCQEFMAKDPAEYRFTIVALTATN
ncbi:hypothetical protein EMCRGX_G034015 [Ephydatia muelleri]|eukprot:Em0022g225a